MKKCSSLILVLAMVLAMLAGCGSQEPAPSTQAAEAPKLQDSGTSEVQTVDEFLAVLSSNTEITLAPGTYDLTQASDYGKESQNPAYRWEARESGFCLVIQNVSGLILSGTDAVLAPQGNAPIQFEKCTGITLNALSLKPQGGEMADTVGLFLKECSDVTLDKLTLDQPTGSGITLTQCQNVTVTGCKNRGAYRIYGSQEVTLDGCEIHNFDASQDAAAGVNHSAVLDIAGCENLTVKNCQVANNKTALLLKMEYSRKVYVNENTFTGNAVMEAAFRFWSSAPHLENNTFQDNASWAWYYPYSEYAVDANGADITEELLSPKEALKAPGAQKEVRVANAEEFLNAIGPDTKIILDCELLDLSTAPNYGKDGGRYYSWEDTFDGPQLVISQVDNLTITAEGDDIKAHTISAVPRYANVLSFRFCTNLTLSGFTAGHTGEPGFCMGGVLDFRDCRQVKVDRCGLYGCGILGITGNGGDHMTVTNCDIYECSNGGISIVGMDDLTIENTTFRDLGGPDVFVRNCKNALWDGEPIPEGA